MIFVSNNTVFNWFEYLYTYWALIALWNGCVTRLCKMSKNIDLSRVQSLSDIISGNVGPHVRRSSMRKQWFHVNKHWDQSTSLGRRDLHSVSYRTPVTMKWEYITASQFIALSHHIYRPTLYGGESYISTDFLFIFWINSCEVSVIDFTFNLNILSKNSIDI